MVACRTTGFYFVASCPPSSAPRRPRPARARVRPPMRIPRVRFTVRSLMVAVILFAALLAAFEAGRRWERRRQAAASQARLARYEALYRQQLLAAEAALSAAASARMT